MTCVFQLTFLNILGYFKLQKKWPKDNLPKKIFFRLVIVGPVGQKKSLSKKIK
jgi:hypothetical protein